VKKEIIKKENRKEAKKQNPKSGTSITGKGKQGRKEI